MAFLKKYMLGDEKFIEGRLRSIDFLDGESVLIDSIADKNIC